MGTFKQKYTKEEADELLAWMDTRPQGEMQLASGIVVKDIAKFIQNMQSIVQERYDNPCFAGQIEILMQLKEALTSKNEG